jgi:hypothetical protein
MSDDETLKKPDLKVVSDETAVGANNPTSVFDDLASLRKSQKLTVQRKTVLVNVIVGKPPSDTYFRAHPTWVLDDATVLKTDAGDFLFVLPGMRGHPKLKDRLRKVTLAAISLWPSNEIMIWPVPILSEREFKVWKSARRAYDLSREQWMQISWSQETSDYVVESATEKDGINNNPVDPVWPQKTFEELLKIAFDGRIIDNEDHSYVRRLRGLPD